MNIKQLAPNQISVRIDNNVFFQSYDTVVCKIEDGNVTITERQPQSKTTAKWLNVFLQENTGYKSYKDIVK